VGTEPVEAHDLGVIPMTGSGKERSDVFHNSQLASVHIDELLAQSAAQRLARSARSESRRHNRIASAFSNVWSSISGAANGPTALPTLTDYPFRG
jgi:hypothetical protein